MAASSSSAISSEGLLKKYDVFISFRGEDTRSNFLSHLHKALCQKKLEVFIDDGLNKGDEISAALIKAIKESYVSLIIFSKNYAASKWCLNELAEIIECNESDGQVAIPVFFKVDPTVVRKQSGSYKNAFVKHEEDLEHDKGKVLKWRTVLTKAANLAGFHSRCYRTESELIEEIVINVQKKVSHMYPNIELRGLVGLHQNLPEIETLLAISSKDVRIIGIWGMSGIGKTTLAKALFAKYLFQYEGGCFLENVRVEAKKHGLNHLRNRLLSELLGEDNPEFCTPGIASSSFMRRLRSKKVFIVLDDVEKLKQLEYLVGNHGCLGLGSRVILTTRDKQALSGEIDGYHEVNKLNCKESLQLFSLKAFNKSNPKLRYEELSVRAINYAKGVPLALEVLGSFLRSKSAKEWDSTLRKLEKNPIKDIHNVLRLSYDELDHIEKEIFLDIACFMKGWYKDQVRSVLEACGFYADIGLRKLIDKALITISNYMVEMHDLIQEMGWEIVRQESIKDLGRRSRLWNPEEVYHVLRNNRGTDAIEGILLDEHEFGDLHLEPDVFRKMINLRFLIFGGNKSEKFNLYLSSNLESLPDNLRYLRWRKYPLKSLPSTFHPEKLVELDMQSSQVEKLWDGVQNLANLETINLDYSENLLELPDLSRAKNLRYMFLNGCTSLHDVHPSILPLPKLEMLSINDCKALKSLKSDIHSTSLGFVSASGCYSLQEFSVTSENFEHLDFSFTDIHDLPPCILLQERLEYFRISMTLTIESVDKLPDKYPLVNTLHLSMDWPPDDDDLCVLRSILDRSLSVKELILEDNSWSELPDNISQLLSLRILTLKGSDIVRLPESMKHLSQLVHLDLCKCEKLQSLPELPPSIEVLDARDCTSLEIFCGSIEPRKGCIKALYLFENCIKLGQHPLNTIMADAYERIKWAAYNLFAVLAIEEQEQEIGNLDDVEKDTHLSDEYYEIGISFPGNKSPDWFSYCSTQPLLAVEVPSCSKLLGFAFCVIIPKAESDGLDDILNYGCECCLVGNDGETMGYFESWFDHVHMRDARDYECNYIVGETRKLHSDHVYIWYYSIARHYYLIMDAIKHKRTGDKMKFSFTFLVETTDANGNARIRRKPPSKEKQGVKAAEMIRSCGVQPIYLPVSFPKKRRRKAKKGKNKRREY